MTAGGPGTPTGPRPAGRRARTRRGAARAHACPERGSATLELSVLFPVVLLVLFSVLQGALFFHGRNVVLAAAEQGVRAARLDAVDGRAGTARATARQFIADTGETPNLSELSITPDVTGDRVAVTVSARTISLLPGVPGPRVSQTASGDIERFTPVGER